ncbi:hypothetical protein [Pseudomonas phage vB_PaeM_C2-10_Ab08]|uniref:Dit-like phage tail protein N-terminal domain-containing protein n=1 Tax=Pseudomonas phage vB_PaeM_C2-10_Ab08 TaxID=1548903 RepID=A0A0A1IWP3_9CAUD|nr:hypothetical protein [Pseudomonas phage vB_PaeM_C2-10_Ab08]
MTIAIKRENGDLIWFDAVTEFGRQYRGSVSSNPIETGGKITDHITTENPVFTLTAIVSDADFNLNRPVINDNEAQTYKINNKEFVNTQPVSVPAVITTSRFDPSRIFPEVITQFIPPEIPSATVLPQKGDKVAYDIERQLIDMQRNAEVFSLLDFRDGIIWDQIERCIFTDLSFTENAETGSSLQPRMTIEAVTFTDTRYVEVRVNKGRKTAKKEKRDTKEGDTEASNATSQDSPTFKRSQMKEAQIRTQVAR